MRKQAPVIEWTIVENDTDWERQSALFLPDNKPVANRRRSLPPYFWRVAALILLLVATGDLRWRTPQSWSPLVAAEVTAQQNRSAFPASVNEPPRAEQLADRQAVAEFQATVGDELGLGLYTVDVQGDQAVTKGGAYRRTPFYRHTAAGWQQISSDVVFWGAERSLETQYFVFHFRENDAPVVIAVARQVDALYTTLRRNFGLPISRVDLPTMFGGEKRIIDVSVTLSLDHATSWVGAPGRITVSSPALYLTPVELTDAELLAQSIALPLLDQVLVQARKQYAVRDVWRPMLDGLRLWQLWEMDLPLALWREEVVKWIYADLPTSRSGQTVVLPARYPALCTAHKLWLPAPTEIKIPLMCAELEWEELLLSPWGLHDPPIQLNQLTVPLRPGEYQEEPDSLRLTRHPGDTVALATLIAYAVSTYGRERLPALLAGLGQYESWETLLPAVYGVSATEFEAGWQNYLTVQYGL